MPFQPPMLLAIDAGAVVAVIFGLISFIGWVMNQVNGAQKPAPPQPRKRAPRDRTIQEEIDQFLSEKERKPRPERRRDDDILTADQVELIDEPPPRKAAPKPVQQKPKQKGKGTQQKPPQRPQPQRMSKPLTEQSTTTVGHPAARAAQLGKDFQQSVTKTMAPRLGATVGKDLPHSVDQSVSQHLGQFSGSGSGTGGGTGSLPPADLRRHAAEVVAMLRNPNSVRSAIIVNEILAPPLSRRSKG